MLLRRLAASLLVVSLSIAAAAIRSTQALEVFSALAQIEQIETTPRLYALLVVSSADAAAAADEHDDNNINNKNIDSVAALATKAFPSLDKLARDLDGIATFAVVDVAQFNKKDQSALLSKWPPTPSLPALFLYKDAPQMNPYTHKLYRTPSALRVELLQQQPSKLRKLLRDSVSTAFVDTISSQEVATPSAIDAFVASRHDATTKETLILLISKQPTPPALFRAVATAFDRHGLRFAFVHHDASAVATDASALLARYSIAAVPSLLVLPSNGADATVASVEQLTTFAALQAFVAPFVDADAIARRFESAPQAAAKEQSSSALEFLTAEAFETRVGGSNLVWIVVFMDADRVAAAEETATTYKQTFQELQKKAGMVALAAVDCTTEKQLCERFHSGAGSSIRVFPLQLTTDNTVERAAVLPEVFSDMDAAKDAALASLPVSPLIHTVASSVELNAFVARAAARDALPIVLFASSSGPPSVLRAIALSLPASNVVFAFVPNAGADVKAQFTISPTASTALVCLVVNGNDKENETQQPPPFGVVLYNKKTMGAYTYEHMMHFLLSVLAQYPHPAVQSSDHDAVLDAGGDATTDTSEVTDIAVASTLVPYLTRANRADLCGAGASSICAIGFLDEHVDRLEIANSSLQQSLRVLATSAQLSQRLKEPYRFMWTSGACQRAFADAFGVGTFQMPTVVVYAPSKRRFATNVGSFTVDNTRAFLQSVLSGKIRTAPVATVPDLRDECLLADIVVAGGGATDSAALFESEDDNELLNEILADEQSQRKLLEDELRKEASGKASSKKKSGKKRKSKKGKKSSASKDEL